MTEHIKASSNDCLFVTTSIECRQKSYSRECRRSMVMGGLQGVVPLLVVALMVPGSVATVIQPQDSGHHICETIEITGNASELEQYQKCSVIEGHLRLQLIDDRNLTWPHLGLPNLTQVTGYVLLYRLSYLRTLRHLLPRLAVIRGDTLFHGHALVIFGNIYLQELGLTNLTHILQGSVRVAKNWSLCPGIDNAWRSLTTDYHDNVIEDNYGMCIYNPCEERGNCVTKLTHLHTRCTPYGTCHQGEECHYECVGGCFKAQDASSCVACRNYQDGSTCVATCSPTSSNPVHHLGYRCISKESCIRAGWKLHTLEDADEGQSKNVCVRCHGDCTTTCKGATITSSDPGRWLRGCQRVEGNLQISVDGGWNLMQQLEENLGELRVVTGYIRVYGSNTLFSLNFLRNLELIGGEDRVHDKYALYILENENLQELWDMSQNNHSLVIAQGTLFSRYNPLLCPKLVHQLANLTGVTLLSPDDVSNDSNEDVAPCYGTDLSIEIQIGVELGTISVSWTHNTVFDHRYVIGYYVYYRETDANVTYYQGRDACNDKLLWERYFLNFEKKRSNVMLRGLKPFTRYALYVSVYNIDTEKTATRSAIHYITTPPTDPSPVTKLKVQEKGASYLVLTWLEPSTPNGRVTLYEVLYQVVPYPASTSFDYNHSYACSDDYEPPGGIGKLSGRKEATTTVAPDTNRTEGQEGGDDAPECCACPVSHSIVTKEDRQYDIDFYDYMSSLIYIKLDDVDEERRSSSTTMLGWSGAPASHLQREEVVRPASANTNTGSEDRVKRQASVSWSKIGHTYVGPHLSSTNGTESITKWTSTNTTTINITGLHHFTNYRVWVRACHTPVKREALCSIWTSMESATLFQVSRNKILIFSATEEEPINTSGEQENQLREKHGQNFSDYSIVSENSSETNTSDYSIYFSITSAITASSSSFSTISSPLTPSSSISISSPSNPSSITSKSTSNPSNLTTIPSTSFSNISASTSSPPNRSSSISTIATLSSSSSIPSLSISSTTTTTGSNILLRWEPPENPNGPPLAYLIQYSHKEAPQGKSKLMECLMEEQARREGYTYRLKGLQPGTYIFSIKLRSLGGDGHYTTRTIQISEFFWYWPFLVALLTVGMVLFCLVTITICLWGRRKTANPTTPEFVNHIPNCEEPLLGDTLQHIKEEYVIQRDALEINLEHQLGKGCFGTVHKGVLSVTSGTDVKVAVKALSNQATGWDVKRFLQEAVFMQDINSNFVVRLVGVVVKFSPIYVVMELMERGDLKSFLLTEAGGTLTEMKMVELALEAADGMAYLADKKLVHRDLAARNCMLDTNLTLKIGDFGLTRYLKTDYYKKSDKGFLPVRWMAPESLQNGRYSSRSDVWSYGVLLWEVVSRGALPYQGFAHEVVNVMVISGSRLECPENGPEILKFLMQQCWKGQPKERPEFIQLVRLLLPRASPDYQERFERVSFFHSSSCRDSKSTESNDKGSIASGSLGPSLEDAEHSFSTSLDRHHNHYDSLHNLDDHGTEDDTVVDDDLLCLTQDDPYKRMSCGPLSCITTSNHFSSRYPSHHTPCLT